MLVSQATEWLLGALWMAFLGGLLLTLLARGGLPIEQWAQRSRLSHRDMKRFTILVGAAMLAGSAAMFLAAAVA